MVVGSNPTFKGQLSIAISKILHWWIPYVYALYIHIYTNIYIYIHIWFMEKGYEKMIRKQILSAREHSRNDLLEKQKQQMSERKLIFNITYDQLFEMLGV